jgi:maltose alpha-D-glucosyltransferase / alpha-amylase
MIEDLWYKNAVIYSLDLETFMDANGDGVGDFGGLIRRLDYLETLGVDVLWLAPFQPSPNLDNGYDVSDYYGVDPRHGSSGDFVEFVHQARKRGIRVIIDLVVNHTSDQHKWFQAARKDEGSPLRNWYVWSKKRPKHWNKGMVFPGVQESTWTYDEAAKAYYFHRFYEHQPDLNVENPEVRTEIRRIIGFWLQLGVAGFRVDAVPFIIECPSPDEVSTTLKFEYLEEMRDFLQWRAGDALLLGEANVTPDENEKYFRDGRGIQMMFNFWVNQFLFYALATGQVAALIEALEATREVPPHCQWAHFLRNHDELDLGRLSDEQREEVFSRFGPDPSMQLYERGIRRRLSTMLGNQPQVRLAYSVMFALPGTPVIRYGDEIGMGDDLALNERDAVRTPMQWSSRASAGFSTAKKLVHPVIDKGAYAYQHVNVEAQRRDSDSLLNWMRRMIRLRKECPEIGWGRFEVIDTGSPHVLALSYQWRENAILTIHNFDEKAHDVEYRLEIAGGEKLIDLLDHEDSHVNARGKHHLAIDAYGYRWYRIGDFDAALHQGSEHPVAERRSQQERRKSAQHRRAAKGAARKK